MKLHRKNKYKIKLSTFLKPLPLWSQEDNVALYFINYLFMVTYGLKN